MKKIALTLLTLGICLTSLGQPGWDVYNKTTAENPPNPNIAIKAFIQGSEGEDLQRLVVNYGDSAPGWPLTAGTHLTTVQVCFINTSIDYSCLSTPTLAQPICYTNQSAAVTVSGQCDYDSFWENCKNSPSVIVNSPC